MGLSPARLAALALAGLFAGLFFYEKSRPQAPAAPAEQSTGPVGPPPAAVGGLGGNPVGQSPAPVSAYTNESLHEDLERQKKSLGIKRIIPPAPEKPASELDILQRSDMAISRLAQSMGVRSAPQARIRGQTPRIVGFQAPYAGTVAATAEQAKTAWLEADLDLPRPSVDFTKACLVIAPGPISEIKESAGHIVIQYRKNGPQAARYAVMAKTELPVAFELLP